MDNYFDEAGFSASPSVQRGWSPRGKPHCVTPNPHCRRSVMGALDFGANTLIHEATKQWVKRPAAVQFLNRVAQQADQRPTVVVLNNASIHHDIDHETLDRWLIEHRMMLFYLPPHSPELNMIEILWKQAKYHWRRFVTWTRDTIDSEIDALLGAYGSTYQIRFLCNTYHVLATHELLARDWVSPAKACGTNTCNRCTSALRACQRR